MAQTKNKRKTGSKKPGVALKMDKYLNRDFIKKIIFNPHYIAPTCFLLLIFESLLIIFIIEKIQYTEIDWVAYMQEVEGFVNGTLDYKDLKGDTGPLVYPAGFVYVYSVLYFITNQGKNIYLAQYIFMVLYLVQTYLVQRVFRRTLKLPPYALVLATITSYRIHSIYVLRLFNDPIAVLLFYVSLNLFLSDKWHLGSLFYSLAVSVKMNILLYAPCLLIAYLTNLSLKETLVNLIICGATQLVLGLPFLYKTLIRIKGSFDLGRVFEHQWTVNFRFLTREMFENRIFHLSLLSLHVLLLVLFTPHFIKYFKSYAKLNVVVSQLKDQMKADRQKQQETDILGKKQKQFLDSFEKQLRASGGQSSSDDMFEDKVKLEDKMSKVAQLFVLPFFITNLVGIVCARSLHYQFYSWYFHSLVYLVFVQVTVNHFLLCYWA